MDATGVRDRQDNEPELEYAVEHQPSRYSRHTLLAMVGERGQERIQQGRVLVTGLGALGSLIAMLLARAGVGFLRIADQDAPELHNLHRQILYDEADAASGLSKAWIAEKRLRRSASNIVIEAVEARIGADNIGNLIRDVDVVVDALDNAEARYHVNDAILERGIPYVFGGVIETSGNVMSIIPGRTPCLRCLWPEPIAIADHPRAARVGVLSSVATTVASIQVTETLKILVGSYADLIKGLLVFNLWTAQFRVASVQRDPGCICRKAESHSA